MLCIPVTLHSACMVYEGCSRRNLCNSMVGRMLDALCGRHLADFVVDTVWWLCSGPAKA
jgi:hypothetical protein